MRRALRRCSAGVNSARPERLYWLEDYGSPLRDSAQILTLLREYQLLPEVQDRLIITLAQQLNAKQWLSTQENNALFLAGRALEQAEGVAWQASLNGRRCRRATIKPAFCRSARRSWPKG